MKKEKTILGIDPGTNIMGYGIIKKVIIKFMKRKKINISENTIKQKDIRKFHGAFICNSVTGIQFVKKIGEHALTHSRELETILDKFVYE